MAILENEVWVTLSGNTVKYFENLEYVIPRKENKWGRLGVIKGTKILVKVKDLPKRSSCQLTKICDYCGIHILNQPYYAILKCREDGNGTDSCYECGRIKASETILNNVKYENSLEFYAIANNMEHLIEEYSDKNEKKPDRISHGSVEEYIWNCFQCKGEYRTTASTRTISKTGCPFCAGQKVLVGFNDLWTTHPEIAIQLKDHKRGYEITRGSNKKELFKCRDCGNEEFKKIGTMSKKGYICRKCSDGISYPEKIIISLLNQINIKYIPQHIFKWSVLKKYDFYIPSLNMIIETHGKQHYIGNDYEFSGWKSLEEVQINDSIKEKLAKDNFISNYVVLDCRESNLEFIKNSIFNSILVEMFNINNVDWKKCQEFACKSLVKSVCEIWNDGVKSTKEIGKIVKLHSATVSKYLKQGAELGWCDYDSERVKKREIVQLSLDGTYIREWDSITEMKNETDIENCNVSAVCKGKLYSAGGFIWAYKEDYESDDYKFSPYPTHKNAKAIIQLSLNDEFIKEWNSTTEVQKTLGINNISIVLSGKIKSAGGFKWMLKSDYNHSSMVSKKI